MSKNKAAPEMNEQFKQFTDLQAKSMEPMREFATLATETTEKLLRKNYEVMGEWIEHTVKQAQLPLSGDSASSIAEAQMAEAKQFSEKMGKRTEEYTELAKGLGEKARDAASKAAESVKVS